MFGNPLLYAHRINHTQRSEVCFQTEDVQLTTHSTVLHFVDGNTHCEDELHR